MTFNWEQYRSIPVRCKITMRETYNGNRIKPECLPLQGKELNLVSLWKMDNEDPYPGEYALTTPNSCRELYELGGITWIASGDVTPIKEAIK